jgi:hypothetical protein
LSVLLLFASNRLNTSLEGIDQLRAIFCLPQLVNDCLLLKLFLLISQLLLSDLLLKFLNLIKSPNKVLFEVAFDVISYLLHAIVEMVDFASVELILDEIRELLIVVLAVFGISRAFSFGVRPIELCLEPEQFSGCPCLIRCSRVVGLRVKG